MNTFTNSVFDIVDNSSSTSGEMSKSDYHWFIKWVFLLIILIMGIFLSPSVYASNIDENNDFIEAEFPGGFDALYEWIINNAHYPSNALANNISSDVVVNFEITANGKVDSIFIDVEGYPEFDYEVYRLISQMPLWIPAKRGGRVVPDHKSIAVLFNANQTKANNDLISIAIPIMEEEYSLLDYLTIVADRNRKLPKYAGMDAVDRSRIPYLYTEAKFKGGISKLMDWLSENISYPEQIYKQGIEGVVQVKFRINEEGSIDKVNVINNAHPLLESEALRVVNNMPKWIPSTLYGMPTVSYYTLPITFKIPKEKNVNKK